jgi:protocatechuate 3,4-dioxygenase beta subunit
VALTPTVLAASVISGFNTGNLNFLDRLIAPPVTATVSGSVLQDTNGNGVLDAGDAPLPGVTVQLRNTSGGVLASFVTDFNGAYAFSGLTPGTYQVVQFVPANFTALAAYPGPGGIALSPTVIQVTAAGGVSGNNNFLDRFTQVSPTVGSLSGSVLRDNGNGFIDPGDTGLPGVTLQLFTQLGVFVGQTATGANGSYSFTNLPPGGYLVQQLVPAGYVALTPTVLAASVISGFNTGNLNFLDRLIAPPTLATISGSVIVDTNGNSVIDPGDTPLPGALVQLRDLSGNVLSQFVTDANGAYAFGNLSPGTYRVVHIVPTNLTAVAAFPGPGGSVINAFTLQVTTTGGVAGNNNFLDRGSVVSPTVGSISGRVLLDANGNGVLDMGDTGLPGVTVRLFTLLGVFIAQMTTDPSGAYSFTNLPPGTYQVVEVVPAGFIALTPNVRTVTVIANVNQNNINFLVGGTVPPVGVNTISGFAVRDLNVNGIADNEPGLAGMIVTLRNSANVAIASMTTDVTGIFSFSGLSGGTYSLTATPPFGLFNTNAIPGQGGVRVNAATILVTTTPGITSYPGQLFLAGP